MFDLILKILLCASTLAYAVDQPLGKFDLMFFQISVFILMLAAQFSKPKRFFKSHLITAIVLICLANVFFMKFYIICLSSFFNLCLACLGIFTIANHCENPKACQKFIVYGVLANLIVFSVQRLGWNPILNDQLTTGEEGGVMGNIARLSTYVSVGAPFMGDAGIFVSFALGIFGHEAGLLLVGITLLFFRAYQYRDDLFHSKALLGGFLTVIFIALILIIKMRVVDTIFDVSIANRLPIWKCTIEQLFQNPWTGIGLANKPLVTSAYHQIKNQAPDFLYSSYLQFIVSVGLAGAAWIFSALYEFKKRFDFSRESFSVLALLILSIFKYPIEIPRLWLTLISVIAFFLIKTQKEKYSCS